MAALHVVVNGLADVMEQPALFGDGDVRAQFFGEHVGDLRHFNGVRERILSV